MNDTIVVAAGYNSISFINTQTLTLHKQTNFKGEILHLKKIPSSNKFLFATADNIYEYNFKMSVIKLLLKIEKGTIQNFTIEDNVL